MMAKLAWRSVRQHPVRFGMSVLVVVLGISFVTGTFSLRSMMSTTFSNIVDSAYVAQTYVRGEKVETESSSDDPVMMDPTVGRTKIDMALADRIGEVPDVAHAIPDVNGTLVLIKADGTAASSGGAPTLAFGLSPDDPAMRVISGTRPAGPQEIALDADTMERSGLTVGSHTQIILGGKLQDVTVSGELHFGTAAGGASLVGLDFDTAVSLFAPEGHVELISVFGREGVTEADLMAEVAAALSGESVDVVAGQSVRDEATAQIESMLGFVSTFLMVFALIALVVGGFIIANTFTMVVRQRLRENAVLRAIGASPLQVFASVVGQAAIVGVLGSVLGIGGGIGLVYGLRAVMANFGMNMSGGIPLDASTVIIALVVGVLVCVLSAALPARGAARVAPVEAMRDTVTVKEKALRVRGLIGALLIAGGIGSAVAATQVDEGGGPLLGIAAVALLAGMIVTAPAVTRPVVRVMAAPFVTLLRPVSGLARDNVVRNPRRTAATSGALMIGMALVGAASVLAASAQASVGSLVDNNLRADFIVTSADYMEGVPADVIEQLRAEPGLEHVSAVWYTFIGIAGEQQGVIALGPDTVPESVNATVISGDIADFGDDRVFVSKDEAAKRGWEPGSTIEVTTTALDGSQQATEVTVAAVIDIPGVATAIMPSEQWYFDHVPQPARYLDSLYIRTAPDMDPSAARAEITEVIKPYVVLSVMDQDEFSSSLADQVQQVLIVLYALLGLSIIIAILGIVNTLALSIIERTREIGLLRAVGMGRMQLSGVVVMESILIAIFGAVGGLAVGVGLAAAMPSVFDTAGFDQLAIPWAELGGMIGLAALVGLFAAVWPAVRASRLPVLDALAYE